jgi:hypothetical protein
LQNSNTTEVVIDMQIKHHFPILSHFATAN